MMRAQVRANNKRIYADIGKQLGLNKEDTGKLIDMLTDQQVDGFARMRESGPLDQAELQTPTRRSATANIRHELETFLGPSKTAELRDYQADHPGTTGTGRAVAPARRLRRPLAQRRAAEAHADRARRRAQTHPHAEDGRSATTEDYSKAYTEWQSDYNERVNAQAQGILNTEQLASFTEYQQWQKEMREQVAVGGEPRPAHTGQHRRNLGRDRAHRR